jgi:hypothetical protein
MISVVISIPGHRIALRKSFQSLVIGPSFMPGSGDALCRIRNETRHRSLNCDAHLLYNRTHVRSPASLADARGAGMNNQS